MSRNSKLISENLREEIAKELGVYDKVKKMVVVGQVYLLGIAEI